MDARRPTYAAFDLLIAGGIAAAETRKAVLARFGEGAERWIALTNGIVGEGRARYRAVVDADLEGIVAKHLADVYHPKLARWHKIINRAYTQRRGAPSGFVSAEDAKQS